MREPPRRNYAMGRARWIVMLCLLATTACGSRSILPGYDEGDFPDAKKPVNPPQGPPSDRPPPNIPPAPDPDPPDPPDPPQPCQQGMCADDGNLCNGVERCDRATNSCIHVRPLLCDDGVSCNGVEACDPRSGCLPGMPIVCDAPRTHCDEASAVCVCDEGLLLDDCSVQTTHFPNLGSLEPPPVAALLGSASDVAPEGRGIWITTADGVDYLDTSGTPFDPADDRWAHFDTSTIAGLEYLRAVVVGPDGLKYFWSSSALFALDDGGTPLEREDDRWATSPTDDELWVAGAADDQGTLFVVAESGGASEPRVVVWDRGDDAFDPADDVTVSIPSGLPGFGRTLTIDTQGAIWLGTESDAAGGNLYHFDHQGTPTDPSDDVFTAMRPDSARVWKLAAHPSGGVWCTVGGQGQVHYFDPASTPRDTSDDSWVVYPELGSAMEVGREGKGWFRISGGVGFLDTRDTPLDPRDDGFWPIYSGEGLKFQINLYSNGTVDRAGNLWVAGGDLQVFRVIAQ